MIRWVQRESYRRGLHSLEAKGIPAEVMKGLAGEPLLVWAALLNKQGLLLTSLGRREEALGVYSVGVERISGIAPTGVH